jgi:hypothetical protein
MLRDMRDKRDKPVTQTPQYCVTNVTSVYKHCHCHAVCPVTVPVFKTRQPLPTLHRLGGVTGLTGDHKIIQGTDTCRTAVAVISRWWRVPATECSAADRWLVESLNIISSGAAHKAG